MAWMERRTIWVVFVASWLFVAVSASAPARGDDRNRAMETPVLAESMPWAGTNGAPAIQEQRTAFHDQVVEHWNSFAAGKITCDLLLESERFLTQADLNCCAPAERMAAIHLSLQRNQQILALCRKQEAAGRIRPADLKQAEGQLVLVELMEKNEQHK